MVLKPSFAQTSSLVEPDYNSKHSYTEEMKTFYIVEDVFSVAELDKLKLIPKSQTKRYDKYLNEDNEITTIVHFLDSENIYQDWMTVPHKIIVDAEGVTSFSAENIVISAAPHGDEYPNSQNGVEKSLFVTLPAALNEDQISSIEDQGFNVNAYTNGTATISKDGIEIHSNPTEKSTEKVISKDGALIYSEKRFYQTLSSGEHVLEKKITRNYLTLYNGVCAEKVTVKTNSEHEVNIKAEEKSASPETKSNPSESISFQIFPVPVGDLLTISAKADSSPRSWFTISIFDTSGRSVFTEQEQNPFPYNISTNQLPGGTYIIKIEGKKASWTERFIKL